MNVSICKQRQRLAVDVDAVCRLIIATQLPSGEIPWSTGDKTDPWDHVESAMGLTIGGRNEEARAAYYWLRNHQHDDGYWVVDCGAATENLLLAAFALGLGSCWGGYFYSAVNAYLPLFEALDLPADHRAFGAVMVGYPKLKYRRSPLRKEPRVSWK